MGSPSVRSRRIKSGLLATAAVFVAAGGALADTVNFEATSRGMIVNADDLQFTAPSFTVVASAYESTVFDPQDVFFGDSRIVTQSMYGLGVDGLGVDSPSQIDGVLVNEFLALEFDKVVSLTSFTLKNVDLNGTDGVQVFVGGSTSPAFTQAGLTSNPSVINFATPLVGSRFIFTVAGGTFIDPNLKSDYSLASITAHVAHVVPLPTAAMGGLALLCGIAVFRQFRGGSRSL
jgi:hypothetical protein